MANDKIIIKIEFNYPIGNQLFFKKGSNYTFFYENKNEKLNAVCIGKSRIDGFYMFEFERYLLYKNYHSDISNFKCKGYSIKNTHIVKELEDHSVEYMIFKENKEEVIKFLAEHFKIDNYDMSTKGAYHSIIRSIKLKMIYNENDTSI